MVTYESRDGTRYEATANYVPAAAVIRKWQALSGITGCKGCVGGNVSFTFNVLAQPVFGVKDCIA